MAANCDSSPGIWAGTQKNLPANTHLVPGFALNHTPLNRAYTLTEFPICFIVEPITFLLPGSIAVGRVVVGVSERAVRFKYDYPRGIHAAVPAAPSRAAQVEMARRLLGRLWFKRQSGRSSVCERTCRR